MHILALTLFITLLTLTLTNHYHQLLDSSVSFQSIPIPSLPTHQKLNQQPILLSQSIQHKTLKKVQLFTHQQQSKQLSSLKNSHKQTDINISNSNSFNIEYYAQLGIRTRRIRTTVQAPPKTEEDEQQQINENLKKAVYFNNQIQLQQRLNAIQWRTLVEQPFDKNNPIAQIEYNHYQTLYNLSNYKQLPLCVVVPTYNNIAQNRYIRNLHSILMQNYTNYHLVIIDDASTDGTGQAIKQILQRQTILPNNRYHLETNDMQMKAMYNLLRASRQFCQSSDIFIVVDGDDQLLGRQVFKLLSATFQREQAWFVYTNFLFGGQNQVGYSRPYPDYIIANNNYRNYPFVTSHLRAFYNQLFLNVKESDMRDKQGSYFNSANDVAICLPILEQASNHIKYLPQITYFYNINTGLNNHIIRSRQQRFNQMKIRRKCKYAPVEKLSISVD